MTAVDYDYKMIRLNQLGILHEIYVREIIKRNSGINRKTKQKRKPAYTLTKRQKCVLSCNKKWHDIYYGNIHDYLTSKAQIYNTHNMILSTHTYYIGSQR